MGDADEKPKGGAGQRRRTGNVILHASMVISQIMMTKLDQIKMALLSNWIQMKMFIFLIEWILISCMIL